MYKYKLKEITYTPGGFKIGDVGISKGKQSTVTDVDPKTGGITWSIEDIAAFDTVYKTFDKLRELLRTLEVTGEAKDDTIIDTISDETNDLFNKFRTHVRRTYPEAYGEIVTEEENINEGSEDDEMAETYIGYAEDDDLSGVEFTVSDNMIRIYQETEIVGDDEEDEEPTEYKIHRINTDPAIWAKLKKIALLHKNSDSLDEEAGMGYETPRAFDKNKKSTGASDIYYYKLGYKPVPKKIKGAGTIVKKLWEKETLNEFSDFQQKRINIFDELEETFNQVAPLISNAKSETVKYYNENPGSYEIVYSTDMIEDYANNIIELLKQEEE